MNTIFTIRFNRPLLHTIGLSLKSLGLLSLYGLLVELLLVQWDQQSSSSGLQGALKFGATIPAPRAVLVLLASAVFGALVLLPAIIFLILDTFLIGSCHSTPHKQNLRMSNIHSFSEFSERTVRFFSLETH